MRTFMKGLAATHSPDCQTYTKSPYQGAQIANLRNDVCNIAPFLNVQDESQGNKRNRSLMGLSSSEACLEAQLFARLSTGAATKLLLNQSPLLKQTKNNHDSKELLNEELETNKYTVDNSLVC